MKLDNNFEIMSVLQTATIVQNFSKHGKHTTLSYSGIFVGTLRALAKNRAGIFWFCDLNPLYIYWNYLIPTT